MRLVYPNEKYLKSYDDTFNEYVRHKVETYAFDDVRSTDVVKILD